VLDVVENICLYVQLVEDRARGEAFDYSSTQLLAGWLKSDMTRLPAFAPVMSKLAGLAQAVQLTSGMGQAEIWSLFRLETLVSGEPELMQGLVGSVEGISDRGKRHRVGG
jgi:midasin